MLYQRIADGATSALHQRDEQLVAVMGGGRGCVLLANAPVAGIWIPLRGRLQLGAGGSETVLSCGEMWISECESSGRVIGRGNAFWLALIGSELAWRNALSEYMDAPTPEPVLLPARHVANTTLRRRAIALARAVAQHQRTDAAAIPLLEFILDLQARLGAAIDRCPGRTYAQRRQVFLRLQRVRNYLTANCRLDLDNEILARLANFSPSHFIRTFRAVYLETPHAFLINQRLLRARNLLRTSPLSISEIATASGFEDRCAFSRLFRARFGMTPRGLRRQLAGIAFGNASQIRAISASQTAIQIQHLEARVS